MRSAEHGHLGINMPEVQFAASSLLTNIHVFGWGGPVAWRMIRTKLHGPVSGAVFSWCGPVYGVEFAD
jgi:hypothetical protein